MRFFMTGRECGTAGKESNIFLVFFRQGGNVGNCLGKCGILTVARWSRNQIENLDKRFTLRHKVKVKAEQWEHAKSLYLAGMEWKAIANELKVSQATLQTKASREGITKVKAQMQTVCTEKKTQSLEALSAIVRSKLAEDAAATIERVNGYSLEGIRDENTREQILGSVAKRSALVFGWSETGEAASVSINLLGSMPDRISEIRVTGETGKE